MRFIKFYFMLLKIKHAVHPRTTKTLNHCNLERGFKIQTHVMSTAKTFKRNVSEVALKNYE